MKSPISILGTPSYEIYIFLEKNGKLFANSGDPDQTPYFAGSDLGLHCLPITLLWVSRLQWVNICIVDFGGCQSSLSIQRQVFLDPHHFLAQSM